METDEKDILNGMAEDMLRDLAILDALKKEGASNYLEIMSRIRRRRSRRVFRVLAGSCAAAVMIGVALVFSGRQPDALTEDAIEAPVLITNAGDMIPLGNDNSYTLDLKSMPVASETAVEPVRRVDDVPEDTDTAAEDASMVMASSVRTSMVAIPQGYTYNIIFDDGSEAYINSGSYIEFPKSFEGRDERRVTLRGEGYFKVAKSDIPFIVSAAGLEVRVYGTEFNVNTNKEDRFEAVLVSGSVGVRDICTDEEIVMKPEEMLTYDLDSHLACLETVDPNEYLAWMRGDFTYNHRPVSELLEEIETFYNIEIDAEPGLENIPITISLSRKLGHRQIMEILEYASGLEFTKTGDKRYDCRTNFN